MSSNKANSSAASDVSWTHVACPIQSNQEELDDVDNRSQTSTMNQAMAPPSPMPPTMSESDSSTQAARFGLHRVTRSHPGPEANDVDDGVERYEIYSSVCSTISTLHAAGSHIEAPLQAPGSLNFSSECLEKNAQALQHGFHPSEEFMELDENEKLTFPRRMAESPSRTS